MEKEIMELKPEEIKDIVEKIVSILNNPFTNKIEVKEFIDFRYARRIKLTIQIFSNKSKIYPPIFFSLHTNLEEMKFSLFDIV
ncbi:MAG: hypothetical protein NC827_05855, partial [Candidatus Omnitrophica bacterium]|nr:hypothetical protein [Candidatus Omnitrophota bacterium]